MPTPFKIVEFTHPLTAALYPTSWTPSSLAWDRLWDHSTVCAGFPLCSFKIPLACNSYCIKSWPRLDWRASCQQLPVFLHHHQWQHFGFKHFSKWSKIIIKFSKQLFYIKFLKHTRHRCLQGSFPSLYSNQVYDTQTHIPEETSIRKHCQSNVVNFNKHHVINLRLSFSFDCPSALW